MMIGSTQGNHHKAPLNVKLCDCEEEEERRMLLLASASSSPLSYPSNLRLFIPSSFPPPSLHLPLPSSNFQTTPLRLHTPPPLSSSSSSSSSSSMEQSGSFSQMHNSLLYSRAYWVSESVIAWNVEVGNGFCYLLASKDASLTIANSKIQGLDSYQTVLLCS